MCGEKLEPYPCSSMHQTQETTYLASVAGIALLHLRDHLAVHSKIKQDYCSSLNMFHQAVLCAQGTRWFLDPPKFRLCSNPFTKSDFTITLGTWFWEDQWIIALYNTKPCGYYWLLVPVRYFLHRPTSCIWDTSQWLYLRCGHGESSGTVANITIIYGTSSASGMQGPWYSSC